MRLFQKARRMNSSVEKIYRDLYDAVLPADTSLSYRMDFYNDWGPFFAQLIAAHRPKLIVEVGSWYGYSACQMADIVQTLGLDCGIACVDTWIGSIEHWNHANLKAGLMLENGYPSVWRHFRANVNYRGHYDRIVGIPMTSLQGLRWLHQKGYKAGLVYLDGSHSTHDVYWDLDHISYILEPDGVVCGDDYVWDSVREAVKRFAAERGKQVLVGDQILKSGNPKQSFWLLKPEC